MIVKLLVPFLTFNIMRRMTAATSKSGFNRYKWKIFKIIKIVTLTINLMPMRKLKCQLLIVFLFP